MSKETCWIGISLGRDNAALSTTAVVNFNLLKIWLYINIKNVNLKSSRK